MAVRGKTFMVFSRIVRCKLIHGVDPSKPIFPEYFLPVHFPVVSVALQSNNSLNAATIGNDAAESPAGGTRGSDK
jgi:hypothetical protein